MMSELLWNQYPEASLAAMVYWSQQMIQNLQYGKKGPIRWASLKLGDKWLLTRSTYFRTQDHAVNELLEAAIRHFMIHPAYRTLITEHPYL